MKVESETRLHVRYAETDQQGVAYHANYLVWMEVARTDLLAAVGYPYRALEEAGVFFAVVEASCRYRGAARYDDEIRITTRVRHVRSRSVVFDYELSVAREPVASGSTTLVALDARRRPRRIPGQILRALGGA